MRDYAEWHRSYDDPGSSLSWRMGRVREHLRRELAERPGPVRIVSACAGDGRDVIGVLAQRPDADRVRATLVELHPAIAQAARDAASSAALPGVSVRTADAGNTDAYAGAVPADVLLLVGILGNVSDADVARTVRAVPQLCAAGATVLWSRGRAAGETNDDIRALFAEVGCVELAYAESGTGERAALGVQRFAGPPRELVPGQQLFTFLR
jgi:hypothetical protein